MDRSSQVFNQFRGDDSLFDSHYTRVTNQQEHQDNWFSEQRAYSRSVLAGWGLPLGELPYSHDNQQTLRCLVELIGFRQKQLQFRIKVKEDMAAVNFEKDKYRSFMEQAQRNLEECMKRLGRTENQSSELKNKSKKTEQQSRKQRDDDRKMIAMLRTKNQQILHEIKKKQQEVNRIKEQMKKSVGEKSLNQAKNSFEIFEVASPLKREPSTKETDTKYSFLLERNEKQMGYIVKQNTILREKLFEIRESLLDFNEWIDRELFGQKDDDKFKRKTRFPLNHNLLFKKQSLTTEFQGLLEIAKDGIIQVKSFYKGGGGGIGTNQKKARSSELLPPKFQLGDLNFKKKEKVEVMRTDRSKPELRSSKDKKGSGKKNEQLFSENVSPRTSKKSVPVPKFEGKQTGMIQIMNKNLNKGFNGAKKSPQSDSKSHKSSISLSELQLPFEDELMSDVRENQDQDNSIVSHIEVSKLGKNKFDKWDILYQQDQ